MHKLIKRNKRMTGLDAAQPSEASEDISNADMYCWGDPVNGALGLGETRESNILAPREVKFNEGRNVKSIASGLTHTLVLLNGGEVYSCGSNNYGQLGHERPNSILHLIDSLGSYKIVAVACGEHHSLALDEWGQVLSWGSNSVGQLGLNIEEPNVPRPRIIKELVTSNVVQIACGRSHCLVLTNDGKLYSWGLNDSGQLGLGSKDRSYNVPQYVESLLGLPISLIACGGFHSFCLSKSGAVYGWGKNNFGQLGLDSLDNHTYPSQLKTLRAIKVKYIVCGEDFSVFLTQDGGVLTCGAGSFGQLGHNSKSNEVLPRKVIELMGTMVTQVVCGRFHTLAFVASQEKVLAFGLGTSGQLGNNELMNSDCPVTVQGPWANGKGFVEAIYAGGNHCFVTVTSKKRTADYRHHSPESNIWTINVKEMKQCEGFPENKIVDQELLTYLETVLGSQACINGSFLIPGDQHYCSSTHHGIDMETAQFCFTAISRTNNATIKDVCLDRLSSVLQNLSPSPPDVETLRLYLTLPLYHEFDNTRHFNRIQKPFCLALLSLKTEPSKIVGQWYYMANEEYFERLVRIYKNVLIDLLAHNNNTSNNTGVYWRLTHCDRSVVSVLDLLAMLYRINYKNNKIKLSQEQFYIPELTTHVDVRVDFIRLATDSPSTKVRNKYLCNYPFIFDAEAKMQLLQTDQSLQMNNASSIATHIPLSLLQPGDPPPGAFLELYVRRDRLLQDTITQLGRATETDYKKPLKVTFIDEEAEDAGGVRKEFFMLILPEVLDPKYGMFKTAQETNNLWFSEFTFEDETMFFIVGLLCGLAIYNFIIINVPFPLALYKKLLGEPVYLSDLMDLSPTVARSLQTLLDYENDDVEDVFCLTFQILTEVYGEKRIILLKPNGGDIPVTKENKKEYVDLYIDYIFNESVKNHYNSFHYAFHKVCGGEILKLFRAQELMAVVTGSENYDWETLENNTEYKNGYKSSDRTIRLFWEVFHELPEEEKKKFLLFLTGTDRIPIQGMQAIKIYIQPTRDDRFLPVAHTCFNLLDLPRYSTKERLRYKLLQAIQNNQGFSLV